MSKEKKESEVKTEVGKTNIYQVLHEIQKKLESPKSQHNDFGGYNYRSCEDILEAVKPMLPPFHVVILKDEIIAIEGRVYIKSTASLFSDFDGISSVAYAREAESKKGMDASQCTGTASSYARKYALSGLLGLSGGSDPDSMDNSHEKETKKAVDTFSEVFGPPRPKTSPKPSPKASPKPVSDVDDSGPRAEAHGLMVDMHGEDYYKQLMEITSFKSKDGKEVKGKGKIEYLSGAWLKNTLKTIRNQHKKWSDENKAQAGIGLRDSNEEDVI